MNSPRNNTYTHSRMDELTAATTTGATLTSNTYRYDAAGNRISSGAGILPGSLAQHNARNQLQQIGGPGTTLIEGTVDEKSKVLVNGQPAKVLAISGTPLWKYERIIPVVAGDNNVTITATDASGNTRAQTYIFNVPPIQQTLNYDDNGNLKSDGLRNYDWDSADRLLSITQGTHRTEFTYDALSRRVKIIEKDNNVFTTAKRYNLMGLSFTDDVVGNQAQFTITSIEDPLIAKISKIDTTLNGRNHHFAAFPLHFKAGDTVTVKTTITNPSDKTKTLPLQWNQYSWDAMNKDNLRFTKTEVVTLAAKETKTVTYEVQPQRESVVYVVATTQDNQAKSILDIRYVRDGIEETRINFPGVTTFPIQAGEVQTLFACAHSLNQPVVPGNILTLTLKDKDGKIIHEYRYEGAITGAMGGFGDTFSTDKNINYATITATLERNGVIVEQVTQTYDCSVIDQNSCLPETPSIGHGFDWIRAHLMQVLLIIVILLLLGAIGVFLYKKRSNQRVGRSTRRPSP